MGKSQRTRAPYRRWLGCGSHGGFAGKGSLQGSEHWAGLGSNLLWNLRIRGHTYYMLITCLLHAGWPCGCSRTVLQERRQELLFRGENLRATLPNKRSMGASCSRDGTELGEPLPSTSWCKATPRASWPLSGPPCSRLHSDQDGADPRTGGRR